MPTVVYTVTNAPTSDGNISSQIARDIIAAYNRKGPGNADDTGKVTAPTVVVS